MRWRKDRTEDIPRIDAWAFPSDACFPSSLSPTDLSIKKNVLISYTWEKKRKLRLDRKEIESFGTYLMRPKLNDPAKEAIRFMYMYNTGYCSRMEESCSLNRCMYISVIDVHTCTLHYIHTYVCSYVCTYHTDTGGLSENCILYTAYHIISSR